MIWISNGDIDGMKLDKVRISSSSTAYLIS
jgi:hypothetical protein